MIVDNGHFGRMLVIQLLSSFRLQKEVFVQKSFHDSYVFLIDNRYRKRVEKMFAYFYRCKITAIYAHRCAKNAAKCRKIANNVGNIKKNAYLCGRFYCARLMCARK